MPVQGEVIELRVSRSESLDFGSGVVQVREFIVFALQDEARDALRTETGIDEKVGHPDNDSKESEADKLYVTHIHTAFAGAGASAYASGGLPSTFVTVYYSRLPLDPYITQWYYDFQPRTTIETLDLYSLGPIYTPIGNIDPETGEAEGTPVFRGGGTIMAAFRVIGSTVATAQTNALLAAYNKVNDALYLVFARGMLLLHSFSVTPLMGQEWEFRVTFVIGDDTPAPPPYDKEGSISVPNIGHRVPKRYFRRVINDPLEPESDTIVLAAEFVHKVYNYASFKSLIPKSGGTK